MKRPTCRPLGLASALVLARLAAHADDPLVTSWFTVNSGKYARVYNTLADRTNGVAYTTWTNSMKTISQSLPAYAGVTAIYSSSNWVYIKTSGLGANGMGPWSNPNVPKNQGTLYRFPRTPVPATNTLTGLGAIGFSVDGIALYNTSDGFSYSYSHAQDASPIAGIGPGDGIWNRDAWVNEFVSFDAALAHPQAGGQYHYHANLIATRYLLGDNVQYFGTPENNSPKTYAEDTTATVFKHSPIIGWISDGIPLYGPYGYSDPMNSASSVRRMISGYVLRDGNYGTSNLNVTGRITLPAWAARTQGRSTTLTSTQYGPGTTYTTGSGMSLITYTLGHYAEDYDYLGDLGYTRSVTNTGGLFFDLNQYNSRFCVTPEFPGGTWAYFATILEDGTPFYPYVTGRWFFGSPTGGSVSSITESVTTNFVGGANSALILASPVLGNNVVTLTWSATEGGSYQVQSAADLPSSSWTTNATGVAAVLNQGTVNLPATATNQFFRVARTGLATYDTK